MLLHGIAIYEDLGHSIVCSEAGVRVERSRPTGGGPFAGPTWVTVGDLGNLDRACAGHKHNNLYAVRAAFEVEWSEGDEVGSVTVYPPALLC